MSHPASPSTATDPRDETAELDDADVARLLAAADETSIAQLREWLDANSKAFIPVVAQAIRGGAGVSAEAARTLLDGLNRRGPSHAEATLVVLQACLRVISDRINESFTSAEPDGGEADPFVDSAVLLLTRSRPSGQAEKAIDCLAEAGPGGALVLTRAFDSTRTSLKLHIVRRMDPANVLSLGENVAASLALSVARLAEQVEDADKRAATRFLAALGPVDSPASSEIDADEPLEVGDRLFHASWGAGTLVEYTAESVTVDFGSAGTRTLLRSIARLRHAG